VRAVREPVTSEHQTASGPLPPASKSAEADLKRNSNGVIEFAGNKPDLERDLDNYLRSREEDANVF
jgi:hypothetical protein